MRSEAPNTYVRRRRTFLNVSREACIPAIRNIVLPPDLRGCPKDTVLLTVKLIQRLEAP